jgi:hypothetical protein
VRGGCEFRSAGLRDSQDIVSSCVELSEVRLGLAES